MPARHTPAAARPGQAPVCHPLLYQAVPLAGEEEVVLNGWLSLATHPWLADHRVGPLVPFPGTAFLELAMRAGEEVGCDRVEELTPVSPLVLAGEDRIAVQVRVGGRDNCDRREIDVYARPAADHTRPWTRHAVGVLAGVETCVEGPAAPCNGRPDRFPDLSWPPPDAMPIELDGLYAQLASAGLRYGPAFQGLRAAWRRGTEVLAEVALPAEAGDAGPFLVHPALLDAVLHAIVFMDGREATRSPLPSIWRGVRRYARSDRPTPTALRARLTPSGPDSVSLAVVDIHGAPVIGVRSLAVRSADGTPDSGRVRLGSPSQVTWVPVTGSVRMVAGTWWAIVGTDELDLTSALYRAGEVVSLHGESLAHAIADSGTCPDAFLVSVAGDPTGDGRARSGSGAPPGRVRAVLDRVFRLLREWLVDERFNRSRLVFVTHGAIVCGDEDVPDAAAVAVWDVVRAVKAAYQGRLLLVDVDGAEVSAAALPGLLAGDDGEVIVRAGAARVPRLVCVPRMPAPRLPVGVRWRPDGGRTGNHEAVPAEAGAQQSGGR